MSLRGSSCIGILGSVSLLLFSIFMGLSCSETSLFTLGGCRSDKDCKAGYECDSDKGVCVEIRIDGDMDTEGELDLEEWNEKCAPDPPVNEMVIPCRKNECSMVNPPECWYCSWLPDAAQDGRNCTTADSTRGTCLAGLCSTESDGDQNDMTCQSLGGRCARPNRICRENENAAKDNHNCEGLCCIPNEQQDCIREGQQGNSFGGEGQNDQCCEGLQQVANSVLGSESGECMTVPDGSFFCIKCGNDVCGPGENYCRCDEDCPMEMQCEAGKDCPAPWCADLVGGLGCQQHAYNCDNGKCIETEENYANSVCIEALGLCRSPDDSECSEDGGYCTDFSQTCSEDYYASEDDLGCPGGFTARCCLPEEACVDDDDCPDDWCQGFSGLPNCIQFSYTCSSQTCNESQNTLENHLCNEDTGRCFSMSDPLCVQNGGKCSTAAQGCGSGYHSADSSGGCPGDPTALCCMPDDIDCLKDEDCGEVECGNTSNGQCIQNTPICRSGQCQEESRIISNYTCNSDTGICEASTSTKTCEEIGGNCSIVILGCGPGYHVDQNAKCSSAPLYVCCVKN